MLIWYKIPHYQWGFCAVSEKWYFLVYGAVFRDFTKSYFISYQHNFIKQKRTYVIFLDIGEILEKGVHESSVCDTGRVTLGHTWRTTLSVSIDNKNYCKLFIPWHRWKTFKLIQEGLNPEPGLAYYSILLIQEGLNTESA